MTSKTFSDLMTISVLVNDWYQSYGYKTPKSKPGVKPVFSNR